jgi:hypothetical protein
MSNAPSIPNPAERIATVFGWILSAVRRGIASNLARLEGPVQVALYNLVGQRLTQTRDRFARLAERLKAGWTYQPRPYTPRNPPERPTDPPPRTPNKLTTGNQWLFRSAPGIDTAAGAAQLRGLMAEPEISAVIAAAPVPAWRILRSVCWMLGVEKPMVLAPPKPPNPKSGKPLYHPPRPLPWEVVPATPDLSSYHRQPSFYWPWIGPKPKTA